MKQVPTESMRAYLKRYINDFGTCQFRMEANGEYFCHFLARYCDKMEKEPTWIFSILQRRFYRCLL